MSIFIKHNYKIHKKNACEPFHNNCYFILFTEGDKQWSHLKLHLCGISGKKLNKITHMISCHGFCMFTGQSTLIMITVHFFLSWCLSLQRKIRNRRCPQMATKILVRDLLESSCIIIKIKRLNTIKINWIYFALFYFILILFSENYHRP